MSTPENPNNRSPYDVEHAKLNSLLDVLSNVTIHHPAIADAVDDLVKLIVRYSAPREGL